MGTAVDDELISRHPCRIKGARKEKAAERRIATVAQVDALAEAVGMRWRLMAYLGAHGPMRQESRPASVPKTSTSTTFARAAGGGESRSPVSLLARIWHAGSDRSGQQVGPGL
jgi:hypothetical protein